MWMQRSYARSGGDYQHEYMETLTRVLKSIPCGGGPLSVVSPGEHPLIWSKTYIRERKVKALHLSAFEHF